MDSILNNLFVVLFEGSRQPAGILMYLFDALESLIFKCGRLNEIVGLIKWTNFFKQALI